MSGSSPEWKGSVEGWVVNHLKKNYWRVERTQERSDMVQEAYIVYHRVLVTYPGVEPAHFMALFKTAWTRRFTDLANADTASRVVQPHAVRHHEDGGLSEVEYVGDTDGDGYLSVVLRQAPEEVKAVLALFLNAPAEILELVALSWKGQDKRQTSGGSKKICQMLGLPEDLDVMRAVEDYFHRS